MSRVPILLLALTSACGAATGDHVDAPLTPPEIAGPWGEREDVPRIRVPLGDAPARGAEAPLVTVVVFTDFECPFCQTLAPALDRLLQDHPDELRVVHRHLPLPFHERAMPLAIAAEEARAQGGDDAFWAMHDRIFGDPSANSDDELRAHARALHLDARAFAEAVRFQRHAGRVEDDLLIADRVGARATPSLFINGRLVLGALPRSDLEALFQEERALALEAMRRGIAREQIYASVMRDALPTAPPALRRERRERRRLDRRVIYAVPIAGRPMRGPPLAPITIVMFSDFECRWCVESLPTLAALERRYPSQIRVVFRHTPLASHPHARDAAAASMEAFAQRGDEGFWQMHDLLVENQGSLSREDLSDYAEELGLDLARFNTALDEGRHERAIDEDLALARRLGASSTPTFYVNGRVIQGAQPEDYFAIAIDDALDLATAELERGTAPAHLYEALMRDASDEAVYRGGTR